MSALLSVCCCDITIPGECCDATWGAAQSDDLSFTTSGNHVYSGRSDRWGACTFQGVLTHPRTLMHTVRRTVSFSNVELKRTGPSSTNNVWSFYNGTISSLEIRRSYTFGQTDCVPDSSPNCDRGYTSAVEVSALNGVYTNTIVASCNQDSSATLTWPNEPSDWTDEWFTLEQQCQNSDEDYCLGNGVIVTMERRQFRINMPFFPLFSACADCGIVNIPIARPSYNANNPDCDANDIPDLDFYGYDGGVLGQWCNGQEGDNLPNCNTDFRNRGVDVFDTSYPAATVSDYGDCDKLGLIMPPITIAAI